jgi:hypothetical protein
MSLAAKVQHAASNSQPSSILFKRCAASAYGFTRKHDAAIQNGGLFPNFNSCSYFMPSSDKATTRSAFMSSKRFSVLYWVTTGPCIECRQCLPGWLRRLKVNSQSSKFISKKMSDRRFQFTRFDPLIAITRVRKRLNWPETRQSRCQIAHRRRPEGEH